jgi:hypothetical protein
VKQKDAAFRAAGNHQFGNHLKVEARLFFREAFGLRPPSLKAKGISRFRVANHTARVTLTLFGEDGLDAGSINFEIE